MDFPLDRFCPLCKTENPPGVSACAFCNHPLPAVNPTPPKALPIPEPGVERVTVREQARQSLFLIVPGQNRSIQIDGTQTVILGRNLEKNRGPQGERILDLTPFEALDRGVSRRHAIVRPVEDGYEICDMGSTNGTWLNQTRILPGRPYRLERECEIRLGRMVLLLVVRKPGAQTSPLAG